MPNPASAQALPEEDVEFEDAEAAVERLDSWSGQPFELALTQRHPALLTDTPEGEPLASLLGRPWELTQFLRVSIGLAVSLGRFHEQGLVHKDIKPSNFLVNKRTGEAWLMGFGITTHFTREVQPLGPPSVIAGTLAYMAPEQTGRVNRSIDSRSDLYAFGITLYEMLTGVLPFTASDPMEWIHCHVARHPVPVNERVDGVPATISAIISKLMCKNAEDRYQTASGVEVDLRRCLTEWETSRKITPFPLAAHDVPDRMLIPERLYGREPEINRLLEAFYRVLASGRSELVLVSGYSGIGKSSVVNELDKALISRQGLFATGKVDRYQRDVPYATLGHALRGLVLRILSQSDTELARWSALLQEAVGANGQLIVNLIPEVELILGRQAPLQTLPPRDSQNRFQMVLRRFLCAFAQPEHPLILFLDDLQWLDMATLDLMRQLMTGPEVGYLLLVGAYRSNEVDRSHPLMRAVTAIRETEVEVEEIALEPLELKVIGELVSDTLHCEGAHVDPLTALVFEKTGGNPFFAVQFLSTLAEERLIAFDPKAGAWTWDLEGIRAKNYTDNVVNLMIEKLNRLPVVTREVLKQLACLGNSAEVATLALVVEVSEERIHSVLWEAVNVGLVFRQDSAYSFLHDRIQEAAYALVPKEERAETHLRTGKLLLEKIPAERREEMIFTIVNQLNRGAKLLHSTEECEQTAGLNLIAANRAKAATAYSSALTYLATGRSLLTEDCGEYCTQLAFAIELNRAECEFIIGDLVHAEDRLTALSQDATTLVDRAAVTRLRVALYTTLGRSDEALETGLAYLRHVGVEWSSHPTDEEVRKEYELLQRLLGDREIDELLDLPLMEDPDWRATMEVFVEVSPTARFADENLHHILLLRVANFSLEHGNCDASCYSYACLTKVLGHRFGDFRSGYLFGKLGVELAEQKGLDRFKARVFMCFGALVLPWMKNVLTGQEWIRRAFETANAMGDPIFAAYSTKNLVTNLLVSGVPLAEVQREAEDGLGFARKTKFGFVISRFVGQLTLIYALRGLASNAVFSEDECWEEIEFEQHITKRPQLAFSACCYWTHKLQALFFAGDFAGAVEAAIKARSLLWTTESFLESAEYHFYSALARAAACDSDSAERQQEHFEELFLHSAQLAIWAKNCPENFEGRAALVAAEIARLEGRALDAQQLYEDAIRLGRDAGFIQDAAVANELAGRFYTARGFEVIAQAYLRNARDYYIRWGADGKVQQLDRVYPYLQQEQAGLSATATIGTPVEHLDLATVVRASQAVSGEILVESLIQTLMKIAIEHAGAERALLILPQDDAQSIEAEATTARDGITVQFVGRSPTAADLPESVLKYVVRTQETVILDDALAPNLFSADSYTAQNPVRSILCLPLVKRATVVGVLYLENATTSHVFTPDRVEILKLLTSQAAISMENARLYTDLRESEDRLRLAIDTIPTIVWSSLPNGHADFLNRRWEEYTGLPYQQGFDRGWAATIHPDDLQGLIDAKKDAFEEGKPFAKEVRIRRADGVYRYFLNRALPLRDESGKIVKWYGTNTDIEDRKRAEEALQTAYEEIRELKDELYRENIALKEEINRSSMFEEIIGNSPALQSVLNRVAKVAPTDSTVLITGETGTGKELVARAIHKASNRSERAFVSVNCAAIPQALIASELFGHEKGAFTGAQQRRLGRFELADGGTILLDEVGELPMETQISLLRVLQERQFERVGGNRPIRTHVRVITATNRNLQAAVADGTFRSDLFYRLNVFPIEIPPLRERKEDIAMLVEYFIDRLARKAGKKISRIKKTTMDRLLSYPWPGNIRELQNVIERSLIVCETEDFTIDESWLDVGAGPAPTLQVDAPVAQTASTKSQEREIIEAALAKCDGRVSGPLGAAVRLNMPASTLDYKIRTLKINKNRFKGG
ncbi:sigma 54-interacting transcriptional regulator [Granulicella sp. dw_53]|uniref:sigma 54-interacting transcriptional regulator n=1 Tax=Granulicella sp. dw_53 TaxID=2719792 RepID=UPI001BD2C1CA|nr:sigma 54-interacting transcriptional regulator [Granulicella sp. dw_53]